MKKKQPTGVRDWKLRDIKEGDIIVTQQGTKFIVDWMDTIGWVLLQSNKGTDPDLEAEMFSLEKYMQSNMEVIGSIYENPNIATT